MEMPKYRLEFLSPALRDLEAIADKHMMLVGPKSGEAITDKILAATQRLETFPLSCPIIDDDYLKKYGYRILVVDKYICVYRLIEDTVTIYHIANGKTNYPAMLKGNTEFRL